jgi:hypothetical protein
MTTLREAAQQALEALRELLPDARDPNCDGYDARDVRQWRATAGALRAALAEPVQPAYWGVFEGGNLHDFFTVRETAEEMAYYKGSHAVVGPIYTTPPAPQSLTIERLRDALVASRIIDPGAVEDPDDYDDGVMFSRIEALYRRIT